MRVDYRTRLHRLFADVNNHVPTVENKVVRRDGILGMSVVVRSEKYLNQLEF